MIVISVEFIVAPEHAGSAFVVRKVIESEDEG